LAAAVALRLGAALAADDAVAAPDWSIASADGGASVAPPSVPTLVPGEAGLSALDAGVPGAAVDGSAADDVLADPPQATRSTAADISAAVVSVAVIVRRRVTALPLLMDAS
jgi:hypothetical protein